MAEISCINLTYKSPHEDVENLIGFNPDGTVNVKYTLLSMKELMLQNLNVITKLLEKTDNITDIIPIGYGIVEVKINSINVLKNLMDAKIVINPPNIAETDEINVDELHFSDDDETNQARLDLINNLVNQNDSQSIFNKGSDSESDDDEIIGDEKNTKLILDKYNNFINNDSDTDSETLDSCDDESDESVKE